MKKDEFPPAFKVGDVIDNVRILADYSAGIGSSDRNEKTISGTITEVHHIVRSTYGGVAHYDYQYVVETANGIEKFWHSPTFLPQTQEEVPVYENCRGCNKLMNSDIDFVAYGYCSQCMGRDCNNKDISRGEGDTMWDRVKKLNDAANKFGTDKGAHGYMGYYADKLPNNPKRLLEIGCFKGASLRMWRELFPNCELHTLDLFEENRMPTDIEGLVCHKGNQREAAFILPEEMFFDVVIDDGSHNASDIQTSFDTLFFRLKKGGIYVIEDLHCLTIEDYRYMGMNGDFKYFMPFEDTILGKMQSGKFPHKFDLFDNKIAFIYGE